MSGLKLIVGLGNPGAEHARTRHNAGFHFVEALAEKAGARWSVDAKLFGETCKVTIDGQGVWLLKPATFMNLSGKSVTAAQRFWKIAPEETLVAHDELDLPVGAARLKFDGGHGGQNGLRDTIRLLGHGKFHRLRLGIGHPGSKEKVVGWVLSRPTADDQVLLDRGIDAAIDVLPLAVAGDYNEAMKRLHTTKA
jgi:peptidyl-tRNA hydrolase, PTH1 family